ncbi:hypothetical protein VE01_03560 [Pseudogymnoascus verrucosus]|uniref:Uncharacterized protein n=1 Tax=Pseudogymnoascus verrucosus TaxID=342668 RepID=A0A1B8GRN2_9PEZI|nr:uncharacterized protein VE01_03560 [Pseudogymnoascus verrucosus]OBT98487.1 hypothetical protein VE01_03560 [Pseudogymnoascus verrucosus]
MQFQYVLVAILAATTQVLAVPATEAKPATELVAVAEGTRVTAATPKADNEDATRADTPAEGIIAATHSPCVDTTLRPSIASAPTSRAGRVHGKGPIQHRALCYGLEN